MMFQYLLARLSLWKPQVGCIYQGDDGWKPDPFDPDSKPFRVEVLDVQHGFVQYRMPSGNVTSNTVPGFASYFFKVKS